MIELRHLRYFIAAAEELNSAAPPRVRRPDFHCHAPSATWRNGGA